MPSWIKVETDSAIVARYLYLENFCLRVNKMTWGNVLGGNQRWAVDGKV